MVSWRERFFRWGPWVAVAVLLWREQSLEEALAEFVESGNKAIQQAIDNIDTSLRTAVENAIERGRSEG